MMATLLLTISTLALGTLPYAAAPAVQTRLDAATADIKRLIAQSGADVSVVYRPVAGAAGGQILINPDVTYHAASTMKVPVMIELFRQVDAKIIALDEQIPVSNVFHSIVDGSEFTLETSEAADGAAYRALGKTLSIADLCQEMITKSSNLATNILIEKLGVERIKTTIARLRAPGMNVLRGVEDQKAFDKGMNNTTTARALMTLLTAIANHTAVSDVSCRTMEQILLEQEFNAGIPAGLPKDVKVGHKTGTITGIHHDAGIVYAAEPYVLVVMTRGMADEQKSDLLIAEISRIVYDAVK
jgi:beta-lactamase class A